MLRYLYNGCKKQLELSVKRRCYSSQFTETFCKPPHLTANLWQSRKAIEDQHGEHTYGSLLVQSHQLANQIKQHFGGKTEGERIVYLTPNDSTNVVIKWAIWLNRAIAVPLCSSHPLLEKQYFVEDSQAKLVIGTESFADEVSHLSRSNSSSSLVIADGAVVAPSLSELSDVEWLTEEKLEKDTKALIIYTSGTTGRPKGVVLSHWNIEATANDMIEYWEWKKDDVCLHVLPLHHIHGLVNAVHVPLMVGAKCVMLPKFSAAEVWRRFMVNGDITVFTAVPTVYAKLLEYFDSGVDISLTAESTKAACSRVRVMISGSSALPIPVRDYWQTLSGHTLLERYGMSEILMALTNPLRGDRVAGTVGLPFASVSTIIAKEDSTAPNGYVDITNLKSEDNSGDSVAGELYVKGPTVFKEYWNRPEATQEVFTSDGWFKTGDTMCIDSNGYYKVLGRTSVDIIKSGGYKISALDIESKLLLHEDIAECAVLGVADSVYGQKVAALIVLKSGRSLTADDLIKWCSTRMSKYSIPRDIMVLDSIARNAMGKINKKALINKYYPDTC